ncbi:hypothetical protein JCM8115_004625 [Rhodotorula mucilaginosa]
MTSPPPRNSTSRSNRDDVLQLLDSLETYTPSTRSPATSTPTSHVPRSTSNSTLRQTAAGPPSTTTRTTSTASNTTSSSNVNKPPPPSAAEAQSVLDFLDEITQRPPTSSNNKPATAGLGRSTSRQSLSSSTGPSGSAATTRRSVDTARGVPASPSSSSSAAATLQRAPVPRVPSGAAPRSSLGGGGGGVGAGPATAKSTTTTGAARASSDSSRQELLGSTQPTPGNAAPTPPPAVSAAQEPAPASSSASEPSASAAGGGSGGGWGWSSMWSSATTVVQQASHLAQQAKTAAEEQVVKTANFSHGAGGIAAGIGGGLMKALGENEQAKKWSEGVMSYAKGAHLDQLGKELKTTTLKSLTDLLNAVAPPIAEHEVIEVSLSHDMVGYDGVEALVYRGLAKIMDQIEGGTLVVNPAPKTEKAKEAGSQAEEPENDDDARDLNVIDGLAEGWKLAESRLEDLINKTYKAPVAPSEAAEGITVPVTTCPVYMRLQPCLAPLPSLPASCLPTSTPDPKALKSLFFLVLLRDPTHKLVHSSLSQSMPASWLEIPFEENEWVEDEMVEIIRRSVEIIGQEYITHRMRAQTVAIEQARAEAQKTLDQHHGADSAQTAEALFDAQTEAEASQAAQEARVGVV